MGIRQGVLAFVFLVFGSWAGAVQSVQIGIVFDGPPEQDDTENAVIRREIRVLLEPEFKVRFPESKQLDGQWRAEGVRLAIDKLLRDPEVNIVLAAGVMGSHELARRTRLPKPVIAPYIIDRELQGIPINKEGASGVTNLNYVALIGSTFERDIAMFQEVVPFENLVVAGQRETLNMIPRLTEKGRETEKLLGVTLHVALSDADSADDVLNSLPDAPYPVFLTPLPRLPMDERRKLIDGLRQRGSASFSMSGRADVQTGILAGVGENVDIARLARRIAVNIQRILLGENAANIPVGFTRSNRLYINMATARAIGFSPSFNVLSEAVLFGEDETTTDRQLSLSKVVKEAIDNNLDLAVAKEDVTLSGTTVDQARANFLPQLQGTLSSRVIGRDQAVAGNAQRSATAGVGVTQVIYDEDVYSNFDVSNRARTATEFEAERVRLDVVLDTANAYLNLLRAKTEERIQKQNLQVTRTNLELAQVRVKVGQSNRSEQFRFESQLNTDRQAVLRAKAARRSAETSVNRLLNRPQEEVFLTDETGLDEPYLKSGDPRLYYYVENPAALRVFRDFSVREGLDREPELRAIDEAIGAQERLILAAKRAYYAPDVIAEGSITNTFARGGGGAPLPGADDTDWSVGLSATIPLFTGGGRKADLANVRSELRRLRLTRHSTERSVEERIRRAIHEASASYLSISLSRLSAEAAAQTLSLITDQYRQGAVPIIDLIDAQNAALNAELAASNAVHDFLLDLMETQRATAQFDFFLGDEARDAWFERLMLYAQGQGLVVPENSGKSLLQ